MPQTKTKIQRIISEYRSTWGRLVKSSQTRDNEAWHQILGLIPEDLEKESDADVTALNKIIAELKERLRWRKDKREAFSSDFVRYAAHVNFYERDDIYQMRRLDIDPEFMFEHISEADGKKHVKSLQYLCGKGDAEYRDWHLPPFYIENIFCANGDLKGLVDFYSLCGNARRQFGVATAVVQDLLCTETDDDKSLEKLVERCMIYDKNKYQEASRSEIGMS